MKLTFIVSFLSSFSAFCIIACMVLYVWYCMYVFLDLFYYGNESSFRKKMGMQTDVS